jgi:prepilin-type N-terminal cleavage/methylation domain-containing protein
MMAVLRKIMGFQAEKRIIIAYDRLGHQVPGTTGSGPGVRAEEGFTLTELLVVIVILPLRTAPVMQSFSAV